MKKTVLTLTAACILTAANAQNPGDLDLTFGNSGFTMTDPYALTGEIYWNLIVLPDDKIIKIGAADDGNSKDIIVAKFLADGTPDSTFATNGFLRSDISLGGDEEARGVYALPSGQLLVTGYVQGVGALNGFIMRLDANGTMDASFGENSGYTTFNAGDDLIAYGRDIAVISNEIYVGASILNGGQGDIAVFNFTQGGSLDVSFSTAGSAIMDIDGELDEMYAMDVTAGGAFILAGISNYQGVQRGFVASLSQFGTPTSFAGTGSYTFDLGTGLNEVSDVIVDENGKIVFVGSAGTYPNVNGFVTRLNSDGSMDEDFGSLGTMQSDPGVTIALFLRGIIETHEGYVAVGNLAGAISELYALYLTPEGDLNTAYGGNGDVNIPFTISVSTMGAMGGVLQSTGSIVIGGFLTSQDFVGENMFMVRLVQNSASVAALSLDAVNVFPNPIVDQFVIQMDDVKRVELVSLQGKVLAAWDSQATYSLPNGTPSGAYIIRVQGANSTGIARVMVH